MPSRKEVQTVSDLRQEHRDYELRHEDRFHSVGQPKVPSWRN